MKHDTQASTPSEAAPPPSIDALQRQLFRYAQDLQELMEQQSTLQQRYQTVLQSLGRDNQSDDTLLEMLLGSIDLYLVTDSQGEITYASPGVTKVLSTQGLPLRGQALHSLMAHEQQDVINALLEKFSDAGAGAGGIEQRQLLLRDAAGPDFIHGYQALVMQQSKHQRCEIYWLLEHDFNPQTSELDRLTSFPLFGDNDEGLMITDPLGNIWAVNPAFVQITGYDESQVLGQNPRLLSSGLQDAAFYQLMWARLLGQGCWTGELFNRRANGQVFLQWQTVRAVKNAKDETVSFISTFTDMSPRENDSKQLTQLAYHDPLTGLPNRRLFDDRLRLAMAEATTSGAGLCVLFLDLDRFKPINDELGHEVGDLVLQEISERLKTSVRRGDTVARIGGDEFVLLLQGINGDSDTEAVVDAILYALSEPIKFQQHQIFITASIGCARYPQDGTDIGTLVKHADSAMYGAKRFGTNFCFYETGAVSDATPGAPHFPGK